MQTTNLGAGRGWLDAAAARSIARIDRALGHPLQITEAGRTWARQMEHWRTFQRNGKPIALHPDGPPKGNGPSIHQLGNAIDSDEAQRHVALMAEHGWIRTVWRNGRLIEPWHFEYRIANDQHRNDPAPAVVKPPVPEEDDMQSIAVNGNQYGVAKQYITHYGDVLQAKTTRSVTSATDELHTLSTAQFTALLDGLGIPQGVVNDKGLVLNPQSGKHESNGTWSREREILAEISTLPKAA